MTEPKPSMPVRTVKGARTAPKSRPSPAKLAPSEGVNPSGSQAIVVLGMHRSGTSALAKILHYLGCTAPKTLIEADENNESGYWESDVVRVLNDRILDSGGSKWSDWRRFNPNWHKSARYDEFLNLSGEAIAREYGSARLIMMKDPRMCRLVPFWTEALGQSGFQAKFIITVRNPLEVCMSLQARDRMPREAAALLWLRHVLDAEFDTRGRPRHFMQYGELLLNWMRAIEDAQQSLNLYWPRLSQQVEASISRFLSADLRHHEFHPSDLGRHLTFGSWLSVVFRIFSRWADEGEKASDFGALDEVRRALNEVPAGFARTVDLLAEASGIHFAQERELGLLKGEAGKRGDRIKELTEELAVARVTGEQHSKAREEAEREVGQLKDHLAVHKSELDKSLDELRAQLADRNVAIEESEKRFAQASAELRSVQHELEMRQSALLQRTAEAEETFRELGLLRQQMIDADEQAKTEQLRHTERAYVLETQLAKKAAELDDLRGNLTERARQLKKQVEAKENELEMALQRLSETESTRDKQVNEIVILTKGLIERDQRIAGYQSEVERLTGLANMSLKGKLKQVMGRLLGSGRL